MASSSGAHAAASQLDSLQTKVARYEEQLAATMARIDELIKQEQLTDRDREELQELQHRERGWMEFIKQLQEKENLLLRTSGGGTQVLEGWRKPRLFAWATPYVKKVA